MLAPWRRSPARQRTRTSKPPRPDCVPGSHAVCSGGPFLRSTTAHICPAAPMTTSLFQCACLGRLRGMCIHVYSNCVHHQPSNPLVPVGVNRVKKRKRLDPLYPPSSQFCNPPKLINNFGLHSPLRHKCAFHVKRNLRAWYRDSRRRLGQVPCTQTSFQRPGPAAHLLPPLLPLPLLLVHRERHCGMLTPVQGLECGRSTSWSGVEQLLLLVSFSVCILHPRDHAQAH
jgi:hypothetical protein